MLIFTIMVVEGKSQWRMSNREIFEESYEFFEYGEYNEALPGFTTLLREDEDNYYLRYLAALCFLNIEGQRHRALPYLQKASGNISIDHTEGSYEERSAPAEALYYLGIAFRMEYRFEESINAFGSLIELIEDIYDTQTIEREIEITQNASIFYQNSYCPGILPDEKTPPVEPQHSNLAVSGDRTVAIYTEEQRFYDAVFFTMFDGENWSRPRNITMQIGSDGLAYPVFLNHDGTILYLTRHDRFEGTNLYISKRSDDNWSSMEKLGEQINSSAFEQHASITEEGSTLYFASNRTGGKGGFDIYRSRLNEMGQWGAPENLGAPVNTPYDDSFPYISPCGKTLYFSSKGHTGMGGYDIFVSYKEGEGNWSVPRNLGYPVNTPFDDVMFLPSGDGKTALTRLRTQEWPDPGEYQLIQLYDISGAEAIVRLSGYSGNKYSCDSLTVRVEIRRISPSADTALDIFIEEGSYYEKELPWGEYVATFTAPGHNPEQHYFSIPEYFPEDEYIVSSILQTSVQAREEDRLEYISSEKDLFTLELKPVFFSFDSHSPRQSSLEMISVVAGFMKSYSDVKVELKGYTDSMGPAAYNKYLAGLRAEKVASMLAEKGIEKERINVNPVGMKEYIARNRTEDGRDCIEGRSYNRRVEFVFINLPEKSEITNALVVPDNLIIQQP